MSELAANEEGINKQFKPKIYHKKEEFKQEISMTDATIRIGTD